MIFGTATANSLDKDITLVQEASFRLPVTTSEVDSWLHYRGKTTYDNRQQAIADLTLVTAMAEHAERLHLDREPHVKIKLLLKHASMARPYLHRHILDSLHVTDAQVESKYQEIKDSYALPRRLRMRNLFKRFPPEANAHQKQVLWGVMEDLRLQVTEGADFAEIAARESNSQTRLQGGLLGNISPETLRPGPAAAAIDLGPGEMSEIIEEPEGLTILFCEKVIEKKHHSPDEMRAIARQILENQKYEKLWSNLETSLMKDAHLIFHWDRFDNETEDRALVEFSGRFLNRDEISFLVNVRGSTEQPLGQFPQERIRAGVEKFVLKMMFLTRVENEGLDDASLWEKSKWSRQQILARELLTKLIQEQFVEPTETQVQDYFRTHRHEFSRAPHYDLAVIALPLDRQNLQESWRHAEGVLHELSSKSLTFADAAQRFSDHVSAADNGKLDAISRWKIPRQFGIDFLRAVLRLEVGEYSDLVEDGAFIWIVKLGGIEEKRLMVFSEAKAAAQRALGNQIVDELEEEITSEWAARMQVQFSHSLDPTE